MKKKLKPFRAWIPKNLDLDALLNEHPTNVPNAKDYLAYLLHIIHAFPAYNKDADIEAHDGYTIISSRFLKKKVNNYSKLIKWLRKLGIIEVTPGYIVGKLSKGYKFKDEFVTELKPVLITTQSLIESIRERTKQPGDKFQLLPEHLFRVTPEELALRHLGYSKLAETRLHFLKQWLDDDLKLDGVLAEQYLREVFNDECRTTTYRTAMHKFNCRKLILDAFQNEPSERFTVDDTSGRLHTLLTVLKSELRAFLTYSGKPLVAVDIKNSQPLLSLTFLDEKLFIKNRMGERIAIYNEKFRNPGSGEQENSQHYILLLDLIRASASKPDVLQYWELVMTGNIYEFFIEKLEANGLLDKSLNPQEKRVIAKKGVLKSLFNTNEAVGYDYIYQVFQHSFPTVFEIFRFIKQGQHETLACALQNLEAEIVLFRASKELSKWFPCMPLFTIHDSIASTEDNVDTVHYMLYVYMSQAIGQPVRLEKEPWDENYLGKKHKTVPYEGSDVESGYGFRDELLDMLDLLPSLKEVSEQLNLKRNKFYEGLRKLGIFYEGINYPKKEYEEKRLLFVDSYYIKTKWGRSQHLRHSIKVTDEGVEYLKRIVEENPELFPKKVVRKRNP